MRPALLALVLLLVLARGYAGPVLRDWPYVRGQDLYAHAAMAQMVMDTGSAQQLLVYPPGFHTLTGMLSRLSGVEPLRLYALLAPSLLLLPALACYCFARRVLGGRYAVAAAFFAGLVFNGAYLFVRDGTYVDLLAAEFLLVLAVLSLVLLLHAPSPRGALLLALLGAGVVLYHSVATIYLGLLLALVSLACLPWLLLRHRRRGAALLGSLALLGVLSLLYTWDVYHPAETAAALLGLGGGSRAADHASTAIGTQQPRQPALFLQHISVQVGYYGLLGALLLAARLRGMRFPSALGLGLLLAWCALFFAASRTSLSAFPVRFTRDLGVPLSITAAYALVTVLGALEGRRVLPALGVAVVGVSLVAQVGRELARASGPSVVLFMTPEIEAAGRWLRAHNEGGNIVVSVHRNQVTPNAMFALSGYSGLPAYAPAQVRRGREVPPRDRPEVEDALWVVGHPGSRRTIEEVLPGRDVRYVVIYKQLRPGSYWEGSNRVSPRGFERRPEVYRAAFENEAVVIYEVNAGGRGRG